MRATLMPVVLVVLLPSTAAFAAGNVGYAQATGYFKRDTRPTLYQPLNLLDAREVTAWCSPTADPLNDSLSFGFGEVVKLEELKISTGNNFDEHTWNEFARASKIAIKSGKKTVTLTLEDKRGPQTLTISPPIVGARFTIEVLDQYPAEDPESPTCLSDIVFVAEGKPLNGQWLTTKLKFDKATANIMGTWFAGFDTTPDKFLSFNFDGTWRYSYEPFDKAKAQDRVVSGTYDASMSRVVIELAGKKYNLKLTKDAAKKGGFTLSFDGDAPDELKQTFRSLP